MFLLVKSLLKDHFGFQPGELPNKEDTARSICQHSPFAVYLLTLTIEWVTQRHYIECFSEEESTLDEGFVRVFRLHWTEEAKHARLDALELEALAGSMSTAEIDTAVEQYIEMLVLLKSLLAKQDTLDLESFEHYLGRQLSEDKRQELLQAMHREYLWTFIVCGLEHKAFQLTYNKVVPEGICSILELSARLGADLGAPPHHDGGGSPVPCLSHRR